MAGPDHADEWMSGRSGGGMWICGVIGVAVVVLLVVVMGKLSKKNRVFTTRQKRELLSLKGNRCGYGAAEPAT
jgi:uncharacterized membrane protein